MVTTRQSQRSAAEPHETPKRLQWLADAKRNEVNDALRNLGDISGITLPLPSDMQSPAKKNRSPTYEIKDHFTVLFFNNREALVRQVLTFLDWLPVLKEQRDEKVQYLLDLLKTEAKIYIHSKQSPQRVNGIPSIAANVSTSAPSPRNSPTMSVKHASDISMDGIDEIQLPPPTRVASNNTSKNTSFANTSFWSEAQKGSQDPPSPATTIEDDSDPMRNRETLLSQSPIASLKSKLAAAYATSHLGLDGAHDTAATQETYYGSSPRLSQIELNSRLPQDHTAITAERSSDATESRPSDTTTARSSDPTADSLSEAATNKSPENKTEKPAESAAEHVRVRNIVQEGLTDIRLPASILDLDLDHRSAFHLVAQECNLDPEALAQRWKSRTLSSLYKIACKYIPNFRPFSTYANCSLRAKMRISDSREGRLIIMEHTRAQKQLSTQLERMYGCNRFLTIDVEPLDPPKSLCLADQTEHIHRRFQEMLSNLQSFLGCTWIQFHAQEKTKRKIGEKPIKPGSMQYTFFAIDGSELPPVDLYTPLNRVLHFEKNKTMSACKLYSRLDLAMSRSHVIKLYPSEIAFIDDTYARKDYPEDTQFNDPEFGVDSDFKEGVVMNDGCGEAHEIVFHWICEALGLDDIPTGAQIRCCCAKGMIYLKRPSGYHQSGSAEGFASRDTTPDQRRPLIWLPKSMRKVVLPDEVFHEDSFDQHLLELRIVQVVHPLKPSYLYTDFLPILIDRHVPAQAIENLAVSQAEQDSQDFQDALSSSDQLRSWLYNQFAAREDHRRDSEIETLANFPVSDAEKVIQMLDCGFEPTKSEALGQFTRTVAKGYFAQQKKGYRIPLSKSTMALIVADSRRHLKPGEIQLNFSQGFRDPRTGRRIPHLEGPVLISRLPAGRPSDIRKVVAVYRPGLSHILDQVIFPTEGPRPLADQCSGGDYDGDKFWICWDPALVEPFVNAPVPSSLPEAESMGIRVNNRTTQEIVSQPSAEQAQEFVRMGTANRMRRSLLGVITKAQERQWYADNKFTEKSKALADLKDRVIDSDKNGYVLEDAGFAEFKRQHGIGHLSKPAYTEVTGNDEDAPGENRPAEYAPVNPNNILDKVLRILLPQILKEALEDVDAKLAHIAKSDESLSKEYDDRLLDAREDPVLYDELSELERKIKDIKEEWSKKVTVWIQLQPSKKGRAWEAAVLHCREQFNAIQPTNVAHPAVKEWLRQSSSSPSTWDLIKASAMAKFCPTERMAFSVAGNELCWLKARASGTMRPVLLQKYFAYKPRKRKRPAEDVVEEEPEEAEEGDVDLDE